LFSFSAKIAQAPTQAIAQINDVGQYTHAGKNSTAAEITNGKVIT
jgi:hypothetical protein